MAEKIKWSDVVAPNNATANELLANGLIKIGNSFDKLHEGAKTFQTAVRNNIQADIAHKLNQYNPEDFYNENRQKTLTDINNYLVDIDNQSGGEVTKEMWQMANDFKNDKIIENNQQMTHKQNTIKHDNFVETDKGNKLAIDSVANSENQDKNFYEAKQSPVAYEAFFNKTIALNEQSRDIESKRQATQEAEYSKEADTIVGLLSGHTQQRAKAMQFLNNPMATSEQIQQAKEILIDSDTKIDKLLEGKPASVVSQVKAKMTSSVNSLVKDYTKSAIDYGNLGIAQQNANTSQFSAQSIAQNQAEKSAIEQRELQLKESGGYFNKDSSGGGTDKLNKGKQDVIDNLNVWNGTPNWLERDSNNKPTGKLNGKALYSGFNKQLTPLLDSNQRDLTDAELLNKINANQADFDKGLRALKLPKNYSLGRNEQDVKEDSDWIKKNLTKLRNKGMSGHDIFDLYKDIHTTNFTRRFDWASLDGLEDTLKPYKTNVSMKKLQMAESRVKTIQGNLNALNKLGFSDESVANALIDGGLTKTSEIYVNAPIAFRKLIDNVFSQRTKAIQSTLSPIRKNPQNSL